MPQELAVLRFMSNTKDIPKKNFLGMFFFNSSTLRQNITLKKSKIK